MLKTSHSVDYFKQAVNQSELVREQKKDTLPSSSQQIPVDLNLPEGFTIGKAIGKGDCFFHAIAQALKQLKPDMNFTVKSLRDVCKVFAKSQGNPDSSWLTKALKNDGRKISYYAPRIEFTANDIKKGSKVIDRLKLTMAMWGLPEIEGRIICIVYKVRLHFIEVNKTCDGENVVTQHLIDKEGYKNNILNSGISSKEIYYREDTIHIINKGDFHFEPILRGTAQQTLLHYYDTMDSESVYFQQNSEVEMKDVIDNQMDCEYYKESVPDVEVFPAKSTIEAMVDYENRLSNEELQYKQSQESPVSSRVADSSSIDSDSVWHSALTDCKSTVGTANDTDLTDYEIVKRAALFVKDFVEEFERKLSEFSEEAKPGSKIKKKGKILGQIDSAVKSTVPPGVRLIPDKVIEVIYCLSAKEHKKGAKSVAATVMTLEGNKRKILVDAGLEIFQKFEAQFAEIMDVSFSWKEGIQKLAIDAVDRVKKYISFYSKGEEFSVDLITKGVVLSKSKRNYSLTTPYGYRVKNKQSGEIWITSELYERVGIKKIDGDTAKYYKLKGHDCAEKYGYRLSYKWELERWKELEQKYVLSETPKGKYVYILDEEKKRRLASSILEEINANDLIKRRDIEELSEKMMKMCDKKEDKNTCLFAFNMSSVQNLFIKRRKMLASLASMLDKGSQELEMSRTVLIIGEHGTGKSELAKSYGYDKENSTWKNIIWIDAETPDILLSSFHILAQELEISIEKGKGIQRIDVKVKTEKQQEKKIKSIVEDIYIRIFETQKVFLFLITLVIIRILKNFYHLIFFTCLLVEKSLTF